MNDISDGKMLEMKATDTTVTDRQVPDPSPLPEVGGDWVLVRPVDTKVDKIKNVLLPEEFQDDVKYLHNVGRVLAMGPKVFKKMDGTEVEWFKGGLKVGDIIQWQRFVGDRFRYNGVALSLIKDTAIKLKVNDQKSLDPMSNVEPQ